MGEQTPTAEIRHADAPELGAEVWVTDREPPPRGTLTRFIKLGERLVGYEVSQGQEAFLYAPRSVFATEAAAVAALNDRRAARGLTSTPPPPRPRSPKSGRTARR